MGNPSNCLICNGDLDQNQIFSKGNDEEDTFRKRSQFKLGLQLFCKLLKIGGNIGDICSVWSRRHGEDSVVIGPPCCKECWSAFEQMLRLQQAIELMQVYLMEQLDKLKAALQSSVPTDYERDPLKIPPEDILGKIRDQLVSYVRNSCSPESSSTSDLQNHQSCQKVRQPPPESSGQPFTLILKKSKEYLPCSVVLERLPVDQFSIIPKTEPDESKAYIAPQKITIPDDLTTSSIHPNADVGLSIRRSKLKAFEFIREISTPQESTPSSSSAIVTDDCCDLNDEEFVPSPEPPSPSQENHNDNDNDEDEYPWESEAEPIPESLPNQMDSIRGTFSLISSDTLLYQYTLINVSQGYTHFTCQEPECPSPHFSDSSLNWSSLFNQIANHIENLHCTEPPPTYELGRKCPLCLITLSTGPQFRGHLISTLKKHDGHRIETVACEICWRPIRNLADAYKCHLWHHKNDQEKVECPEGPPSTIVSKARNNMKLKRRLEKMLEKSGKLKLKAEERILAPKPKNKIAMKSNFQDKLKQTKPKKQSCPSPEVEGRTQKTGDHFSRILENSREYLLLYKYTLLKASYGVSLTCQEPNCDHVINGTDFTAFEEFKNHVNNWHTICKSDQSWKCPLCSQKLKSAESFRRHLLYKCSKAISSKSNLRLICTVCWRPMHSSFTMEYHQWLHKSEIEKECVLSSGAEQPPPTLVQTKEKERQSHLKCRHCQREFKFVVTLKAHEATHLPKEERKKYMCHQCPRLFLSPVAVRGHVEREHQRELMRKRTCPICNKEYNWRDGYKFRSHLRSHRDERNWVCDKCGMAFLNTLALKSHRERVHEGKGEERPWQCEFCEMNYKETKHLKRHRRNAHKDKVGVEMTEDEEQQRLIFTLPEYRPDFIGPKIAFPCPACEKVFPLKSRMKKHLEKTCKNKL